MYVSVTVCDTRAVGSVVNKGVVLFFFFVLVAHNMNNSF